MNLRLEIQWSNSFQWIPTVCLAKLLGQNRKLRAKLGVLALALVSINWTNFDCPTLSKIELHCSIGHTAFHLSDSIYHLLSLEHLGSIKPRHSDFRCRLFFDYWISSLSVRTIFSWLSSPTGIENVYDQLSGIPTC